MGGHSGDLMPREGLRTCGKKQIRLERQDKDIQYRPVKEGRVVVEVSVNCAEKTSYLRTICAEIADSAKFVLLARSSSTLCFPALSFALSPSLSIMFLSLHCSTNLPRSLVPP